MPKGSRSLGLAIPVGYDGRMNQADAYRFLASELAPYRALPYSDLAQLIGPSLVRHIRGEDSTEYAIEVKVRWHAGHAAEILVEGWIAENSCGPVHRLDDSFTVALPK